MQPSSVVRSVCIVCEEERRIKCKLKENESCPILLNKMWNAFVTYFNLNPSDWEDILTFFNQVYEFPFCEGKCRNDVAKLLVFHERFRSQSLNGNTDALMSILQKVQKAIASISATIICSQERSRNSVTKDGNFTSPAEFVNYRIRCLRGHIVQSYQPEVRIVNEEFVNMLNVGNVNADDDEDDGKDYMFASDESEGSSSDDHDHDEDSSGPDSDEESDEDENQDDESGDKAEINDQNMMNESDDSIKCKICQKDFSRPGNLRRHLSHIHGMNPKGLPINKKIKTKYDDDSLLKSIAVVELGDEKFEYAGWNFKNTETGYWCSCGEIRPAMAHILRHIVDEHLGFQVPAQRSHETSVKLGDGRFLFRGFEFSRTADNQFNCSTCSAVKARRQVMIQHIKMMHCKENTSRFTFCEICQRGFFSRASFVQHKRAHKKHRYWPKPDDPNTFVYDGKLEFVKLGDESFQCSTCQLLTDHIYKISNHVRDTHIEPELSRCPNCDYQFTSRGSLRKHLQQKKCLDSKWSLVPNPETGEKDIFYDTKWPVGLVRGTSIHDPNARFQCKTCGQQRGQRSAVGLHIKTYHITPFQYVCESPNCGRRFLSIYYLNQHIARAHSDVKAFKCDYCSASFKVKRNLTVHIQNWHSQDGGEKRRIRNRRSREAVNYMEEEDSTEGGIDVEMSDVLEFVTPDPDDDPDAQDPLHDPFEDESTSDINNLIEHIKTEDRENSHNFPRHDPVHNDTNNNNNNNTTASNDDKTEINVNPAPVLLFQVAHGQDKTVQVFSGVQWVTVGQPSINPLPLADPVPPAPQVQVETLNVEIPEGDKNVDFQWEDVTTEDLTDEVSSESNGAPQILGSWIDVDKPSSAPKTPTVVARSLDFSGKSNPRVIPPPRRRPPPRPINWGKRFVCDYPGCDKAYKYTQGLKHHKVLHENRSFGCIKCGATFRQEKYLNVHLRKVHKLMLFKETRKVLVSVIPDKPENDSDEIEVIATVDKRTSKPPVSEEDVIVID